MVRNVVRRAADNPHMRPISRQLKIATVNDDFTDRVSSLRRVSKVADVMLVQEAKATNVHKLFGDHFRAHQDRSSPDRAGSAVVWDRREARSVKGGMALASHAGQGIMNRWITWNDLRVDGKVVRMASAHRPPPRASELWREFDRQLRAFIAHAKGPIVIGMDANTEQMRAFAKSAGLVWHAPKGPTAHGKTIDGFLASPGIKFEQVHTLDRGPSDHRPVVAKITLPK